MENKSKAETFIGFCVRARKCKIGMNASCTLKKAQLMIVCHTASENTVKEAKKLAVKLHCELLMTKTKTLEEMTHKQNAKVMALTDQALSKAILDNSENDFIVTN